MDLGLQGRKALITGASKGIGEAIARALAAEGCDIALAARSGDRLCSIASELAETHGIKVEAIPIDLSDRGSAEILSQRIPNADILINNSGAIPAGRLDEIDEITWRATWDLKVFVEATNQPDSQGAADADVSAEEGQAKEGAWELFTG